jgi:hypothetical protein
MTFELNFRDNQLHPIWNKLQRGERLTLEDAGVEPTGINDSEGT